MAVLLSRFFAPLAQCVLSRNLVCGVTHFRLTKKTGNSIKYGSVNTVLYHELTCLFCCQKQDTKEL